MTVCSAPPSSRTPSTTRRSVPMPSMRAPILTRRRHRSCTCGSRAALKISVRPSASTAARRMFSVPVTVGRSKTIRSPRSRSTSATISVADSSIRAPIWRRPRRCCSTRRAPMSSPPGRGRRAWPNRPSSAPSSTIVARIRRPSSSGTLVPRALPMRRLTDPAPSERPPSSVRICAISSVSVTRGTLLRRTGSDVSKAAAISGSAAFLEPLTQSWPANCAPPLMRSAKSRRGAGAVITRYGTERDLGKWELPTRLRFAKPTSPRGGEVKSASPQASQPEPGFGDGECVLELGLLGHGEGARQLLLRPLSSLLGPFDRDLLGVFGNVRENRHALRQNLQKPSSHEEDLLRTTHQLLDAQGSGLEHGHEGRVASHDSKLPIGPVGDDELDLALEKASLDTNDSKGVLHVRCSSSSVRPVRAPLRWFPPCRTPAPGDRRACLRGSQ